MNPVSLAILFVTVAAASASGIIGDKGALEGALGGQWIPDVPVDGHGGVGIGVGIGVGSARGALEGALGGQWIPDVPVAHGPAVVAAPAIAAGPWGGPWGGAWGLGGLGHGIAGVGIAGHGVSRGALEGALGGQWIPDTHGH